MKCKLNLFLISLACLLFSCKKDLEIDAPKDSLVQESIFQNDDVATSAVTGIYYSMVASGYASGSSTSITALCGLSADEFNCNNTGFLEFYNNQVTPLSTTIAGALYTVPYKQIYTANSVLEGLSAPNGVTPAVKAQLQGEALFIRAFTYFYLVNLYGPVPLYLSSDYRVTQVASRASETQVYQQIIADLKTAEGLLTDKYISTERVRPNLASVQALLARTYLYLQDWTNAEKYASLVIGKTSLYSLVSPDNIFLKNSLEAIWQLMPPASTNTNEGALFILQASPTILSLNSNLAINTFEANDKRQSSWVKSFINTSGTYYYPYKYKVKSSTTVSEYSMVLRLAEQYLIRAEAETYGSGNGINGAISDLNMIRNRVGLPNYNGATDATSLRTAILRERRVELFAEWGHRWFDLKRTGNAGTVLSLIKPQWQATDIYYPIPQTEIDRNKNITQNAGY